MTSTTATSSTETTSSTSALPIQDRLAAQDVVDSIDAAVDAKDWTTCRSYFTDIIDVDFTSLAGGDPTRMPADDLVAAWWPTCSPTSTSCTCAATTRSGLTAMPPPSLPRARRSTPCTASPARTCGRCGACTPTPSPAVRPAGDAPA